MKNSLIALAAALVMGSSSAFAAPDIQDLLNGLAGAAKGKTADKETTETTAPAATTQESPKQSILDKALGLGNALGIIPAKTVDAAYLAGTWQYTAPAVAFKSDNFLAKAGGIAAAEKVKSELEPYYQRFGLTKAVLECTSASTFTLKAGAISLSGEFTPDADGKTLTFNFKLAGKIPLGNVTAYVNAISNSNMEITFDMTQFLNLLRKVGGAAGALTGNNSIQSLIKLLDNYDGLTMGFAMKKTAAEAAATEPAATSSKSKTKTLF